MSADDRGTTIPTLVTVTGTGRCVHGHSGHGAPGALLPRGRM